jgi:pyrroline-5-carboxylate reductase
MPFFAIYIFLFISATTCSSFALKKELLSFGTSPASQSSIFETSRTTAESENMADLSNLTVAFLGCGKISSAVCRGFAGADGNMKPKKILVSLRSAEKSAALKAEYPDLITVKESNEELVAEADIVFIGLLPGIARELLPTLPFAESKTVISMMAAVDYSELLELVKLSGASVGKTVPLPAASKRSGPVIMFPPNASIEAILSVVGTTIPCTDELQMKPMISLTGHISSFYELMKVSQDWQVEHGVDPATAKQFVGSFYSSLAAVANSSEESFAYMTEEAATPGGLNEQSVNHLRSTEHYALHEDSMTQILDRLLGKPRKSK